MRKDLRGVFTGCAVENVIQGASDELDPTRAVIIIGTDRKGLPYVASSCDVKKTLRKLKKAKKTIDALTVTEDACPE